MTMLSKREPGNGGNGDQEQGNDSPHIGDMGGDLGAAVSG